VKARLLLAALAGVAVAAVPAAALGGASHATSNSQSYVDSTGEDPNAPDITGIDVSNDNSGLITFHVKISNRPTLTPDMNVVIWIDSDSNAKTGDPKSLGADYAIGFDQSSADLVKWNGSAFVAAPSQTSVTSGYDATGATLRVSASDLGRAKQIRFVVRAESGVTTDASGNPDFTNAHDDYAPDPGHGLYTYTVLAKLVLKPVAFTTAPKPVRAGGRLTAALAATENDTGGPVTKATVACSATIKGVRLPATHALANGVASCFWKLPRKSKGKTLSGWISVTVQGTTLTRAFRVRIS
jgi:hypothetical protein